MRSVRIATCTSGELVSPSLVAYSLISSSLRAGVIDILLSFQSVSLDFAPAGQSRDVVQHGRPEACRISRQWAAYGLFRSRNPAESADQSLSFAGGRGGRAAKTRVGFSIPPA